MQQATDAQLIRWIIEKQSENLQLINEFLKNSTAILFSRKSFHLE